MEDALYYVLLTLLFAMVFCHWRMHRNLRPDCRHVSVLGWPGRECMTPRARLYERMIAVEMIAFFALGIATIIW
jgi:hypothetical protein